MRADVRFDGIAAGFEVEIYGSSKGFIRLRVLWEDMLAELPALAEGGLSVLDAGGGAGHMTLLLTRLGHRVVLADPSREMLDRAEQSLREAGLVDRVRVVHAPIQALQSAVDERFDLITCHAVLEWLANPRASLAALVPFLQRGGRLSLMFYNRNARLLKRILGGHLDQALQVVRERPAPTGWGDGAIPLAEEEVRAWLAELGLHVRSKAGIRIFHDHVPAAAREGEQLDRLLELEMALRRQEPFASIGQHIHLISDRLQ